VRAETVLNVRVIPRARTSAFGGMRGDDIVVRLAAPPVEGAANEALIDFLSDTLQIPRRWVRIVSGEHSRRKRVAIVGVTLEQVRARL
jgi:uncharacterized protein